MIPFVFTNNYIFFLSSQIITFFFSFHRQLNWRSIWNDDLQHDPQHHNRNHRRLLQGSWFEAVLHGFSQVETKPQPT